MLMNKDKSNAYNIKNILLDIYKILSYKEENKIFGVGLIIGIAIGANIAVILYACILVNKDKKIYDSRKIRMN